MAHEERGYPSALAEKQNFDAWTQGSLPHGTDRPHLVKVALVNLRTSCTSINCKRILSLWKSSLPVEKQQSIAAPSARAVTHVKLRAGIFWGGGLRVALRSLRVLFPQKAEPKEEAQGKR